MIIDDNSNEDFLNEKEIDMKNCTVVKSEYPRRGELLPYYYFYKIKPFDKAVIIHDSVFIQKKIDFNIPEKINFLWDFEHYGDEANDEIEMIKQLDNNDELLSFYNQKNLWKGCFGVMSIIDHSFLENLQNKYKFFNLLDYVNTRYLRMRLERVYALLCSYENMIQKNTDNISFFGKEIHECMNYPYNFEQYINDKDNIKFPIVKVWTGR